MVTPTISPADVQERLAGLIVRDRLRLQRKIDGLRHTRDPGRQAAALSRIAVEVESAEQRLENRRAAVPVVRYPEELPVSGRRDDIAAAIRDHQVVVVAGETGSGKTTQIPKICLELGRGVLGTIGHTQPRRIAARTVAERIAEELGTPLGSAVGYKVRFTDHSGDDTLVRLMTDGILLAEIQRDRMLSAYDTIIIDEAHERSLNVDFLLGYLRSLLPRRPDLKLIITSATIDPGRFSRHFGDAPVIEVSGRTYPVEVRYRPLVDVSGPDGDEEDEDRASPEDERDQVTAIGDAVQELLAEGPGDVLVFLSGEREIRDTADALGRLSLRDTEIVPLYARLSSAEQHRVFQAHTGRRVVLATNVAETSLTVPGIRYVVDPGTARISRYSSRTKVQRLPIEPVSQASANQRKGRCGRTSDGICIRLYSEEDFLARPEFTDPEVLRTSLASVILAMTALDLGDVAAFPFVDPPDKRNIRDGVALLHELGAIDPDQQDPRKRLTAVGRSLAQLPVDPRLARMVLEADRNGALQEVIVIAAALSIQDPRERPVDRQQAADEKHRRFADETSDFLAYLNLWNYLQDQQKELSSSAFRRMCKAEFLHYLRVREWQDLVSQLRQVCRSMGMTPGTTPATPLQVHSSLLAGLLSHVGLKEGDRNDYLGARGAKFAIFPGSALFKKPPRYVMVGELVETSRLWGRVAARVEPEWVEPLAAHLTKHTYSEPHWEKKRAAVMAYERVTLYGVPIVVSRKVGYAKVDPEATREMFIRHALVEGDWQTHHTFFHENRALLDEVEDLEHRARRRDILVDDEALIEFYDKRLPAEAVSGRHFDAWWKSARREQPDLLSFEKSMLVNSGRGGVDEADYPDTWEHGSFPLTYQFEPGSESDGVTVHIPLAVLNRVGPQGFDWQVPGLRAELVTALIRSLPKPLRRTLVPAPDTAAEVLDRLDPSGGPLTEALARELRALRGVVVPPDAWDPGRVPPHLRMTFRIIGDDGRTAAEGKDLGELKALLRPRMRATVAEAGAGIERTGLTTWTVDTVPRTFERVRDGITVVGYPALVDEGRSVALRVLGTQAEQESAMWAGSRRLLLLACVPPARRILGGLDNGQKLALAAAPHAGPVDLFDDAVGAAVDGLMAAHGGPAWDEAGFGLLLAAVRAGVDATTTEAVITVAAVLAVAKDVDRAVRATTSLTLLPALTDVREHVASLLYPGFISATGISRLPDLLRYLHAVLVRVERLPDDALRDRARMADIHQVEDVWRDEVGRLAADSPARGGLWEVRWLIEELRLSYFAPTMRTTYPVSEKRIRRAIDEALRTSH